MRQSLKGIIYDLDDTLYFEKQYIRSGFKAVAEFLEDKNYADQLWSYFERANYVLDVLLKDMGHEEQKESCLKIYREDIPKIELYEGITELIRKLKKQGIKVGIITDGRVSGQKEN